MEDIIDIIKREQKAIKQKLEHDGYEKCKKTGHVWDCKFGRHVWQGGDLIRYDEDGRAEYSESILTFHRRCIQCNTIEVVEDNRIWKAQAGFGHFECNPLTGNIQWKDNPECHTK